ncbi:MAG: hypothetical protein KAU06_03670 [Candidatus Marinimicrobia bacterium]|nr:hypothetical protein [Candidatus Neomarinimicrobiota bacterium]
MAKDPMTEDVREIAKKHNFDRIIVFGLTEGKKTQVIVHADTDEKREETKIVGDYLLGKFQKLFGMAHVGVKNRKSD